MFDKLKPSRNARSNRSTLPVDVYITGYPPRLEAVLRAFAKLQQKIEGLSLRTSRWYAKDGVIEIPMPWLGPDIVDVRRAGEISQRTKVHSQWEAFI